MGIRRIARLRIALLGAGGAMLLIAGCAGPQQSDDALARTTPAATASDASTVPAPAPAATTESAAPVAETSAAAPAPVAETTSESVAAPSPAAVPQESPVTEEPAAEPEPEPTEEAPAAEPSGYGCDAAIAYLHANAHPAFTIVCPGYAFGGQAVTCLNHAPQCPNSAVIIINVPCAVAYMNEAANSWTIYNGSGAAIDPYGASC